MRKKLGLGFMLLGLVFLIGAAGLLFYNQAEDRRAGEDSEKILESIIEEQRQRESQMENQADGIIEEEAEDESSTYIGTLNIPELDLELPVYRELSTANLSSAPCRYFGSVKDSNLVIAGHNYRNHFGKLKNLQIGSFVTFTDMNGINRIYQVAEIETLDPYAVVEMTESDYDLTLFTCTYGGANRVTIRCNWIPEQ